MDWLETIGKGILSAVFLAFSEQAVGILFQSARRTRWWVRKSPLQRTLLLVFSMIWVTGLTAFVAFLLYIFWLAGADIFR